MADDGHGKHSPFTEALLRNLGKPISIDDMFSLVTREVRLITKNTQRPYKYASLENIFCMSPSCSAAPVNPIEASSTTGPVEQAQRTEADELGVAKATKKVVALENYLSKYPDTPNRKEVEDLIGSLKLSEFSEWTLFELGNQKFPNFVQLGSIKQFKGRAALRIKFLIDPNSDKTFFGKPFPDALYVDEINVYDCENPRSATAEATLLGDANSILYHYKFADPRYLDLSIGMTIKPGSVASSMQRLACNEKVYMPLVTKGQLARMEFKLVASTQSGDGEIFYGQLRENRQDDQYENLLTVILRYFDDRPIPLAPTALLAEPLKHRIEVDRVDWRCKEKKFRILRTEYYNSSNELAYLFFSADAQLEQLKWTELKNGAISPLSTLNEIICDSQESSK